MLASPRRVCARARDCATHFGAGLVLNPVLGAMLLPHVRTRSQRVASGWPLGAWASVAARGHTAAHGGPGKREDNATVKCAIPEIRMLTVPAMIRGNLAILLDNKGNVIRHGVSLSRLTGPLAPAVEDRWRWEFAANRMAGKCFWQMQSKKDSDPWVQKAGSLAKSFHLRSFDCVNPTGKCRFEKYATCTWEEAATRLWHQANNRARRHSRSGWIRWAHTVSSNHNKRKGGRYDKAKSSHCEDDPRND